MLRRPQIKWNIGRKMMMMDWIVPINRFFASPVSDDVRTLNEIICVGIRHLFIFRVNHMQ